MFFNVSKSSFRCCSRFQVSVLILDSKSGLFCLYALFFPARFLWINDFRLINKPKFTCILRILEHESEKASISHLKIGAHTEGWKKNMRMINLWMRWIKTATFSLSACIQHQACNTPIQPGTGKNQLKGNLFAYTETAETEQKQTSKYELS